MFDLGAGHCSDCPASCNRWLTAIYTNSLDLLYLLMHELFALHKSKINVRDKGGVNATPSVGGVLFQETVEVDHLLAIVLLDLAALCDSRIHLCLRDTGCHQEQG